MRVPVTSSLAGVGPNPLTGPRPGARLGREGLAARSLCIPLGAAGRGGFRGSLPKASRAAQSGQRARQAGREAAEMQQQVLGSGGQAVAAPQSLSQPASSAQAAMEAPNTWQQYPMPVQAGAEGTPQPIEGSITPEGLPSGEKEPSGDADNAPQMQHSDLFQQLGSRPLQSLAATGLPKELTAAREPPAAATEARMAAARPTDASTAELGTHTGLQTESSSQPTEASSQPDQMTATAAAAGRGHHSMAKQGVKQTRQSAASALPVVFEAASEEGHPAAAGNGKNGTPSLRRSLLPAVHPSFRSSPLRTPAMMRSLSALPDVAAGQHSRQSWAAQVSSQQAPGSSDVVISSSWDRSAKQVCVFTV